MGPIKFGSEIVAIDVPCLGVAQVVGTIFFSANLGVQVLGSCRELEKGTSLRGAQRSPEKPRRAQRSPEEPRGAQRSPEEPRGAPAPGQLGSQISIF